ncbi:hypothetical protein AACH28_09895 [Sphingobacterium thalpophilum]|uniref:Uncharacterized protein n=1 Tax=Sphingobacterium thalpophilum TaxID=259 RepID=A0ACD5C844_9SPHI
MKKLLMSLIAVAALSTAAFAGTETKAPKENAEVKTSTSAATENTNKVEVAELTKENNAKFLTKCVYTLTVYNSSGQVIDTFTSQTYVENSCSGFIDNCRTIYRHMLAHGELGI